MDSKSLILDCLSETCSRSSKHISEATGIKRSQVNRLLNELVHLGYVERNNSWHYTLAKSLSPAEAKFKACSDKANELENAHRWRRAARVWLEALDSTYDPYLRSVAVTRRDRCIQMGRLNCTAYGGLSSGRMSEQGTWEDLSR